MIPWLAAAVVQPMRTVYYGVMPWFYILNMAPAESWYFFASTNAMAAIESIILCGINGGVSDTGYGKEYYDSLFLPAKPIVLENLDVYGSWLRLMEKFFPLWDLIHWWMWVFGVTDV
tara:strand:+ start:265 stop:615 length:351 start_codon:yes stop_codon:yes gene_type:complete